MQHSLYFILLALIRLRGLSGKAIVADGSSCSSDSPAPLGDITSLLQSTIVLHNVQNHVLHSTEKEAYPQASSEGLSEGLLRMPNFEAQHAGDNASIVNGHDVSEKWASEFPFLVYLHSTMGQSAYVCSGTIIDSDQLYTYIVTAAHCGLNWRGIVKDLQIYTAWGAVSERRKWFIERGAWLPHEKYGMYPGLYDVAILKVPSSTWHWPTAGIMYALPMSKVPRTPNPAPTSGKFLDIAHELPKIGEEMFHMGFGNEEQHPQASDYMKVSQVQPGQVLLPFTETSGAGGDSGGPYFTDEVTVHGHQRLKIWGVHMGVGNMGVGNGVNRFAPISPDLLLAISKKRDGYLLHTAVQKTSRNAQGHAYGHFPDPEECPSVCFTCAKTSETPETVFDCLFERNLLGGSFSTVLAELQCNAPTTRNPISVYAYARCPFQAAQVDSGMWQRLEDYDSALQGAISHVRSIQMSDFLLY